MSFSSTAGAAHSTCTLNQKGIFFFVLENFLKKTSVCPLLTLGSRGQEAGTSWFSIFFSRIPPSWIQGHLSLISYICLFREGDSPLG